MTQPATEPVTPVACPDCLSNDIAKPDGPGAGLSYWRCLKCGVIWNPERPPDRSRPHVTGRTARRNGVSDYWQNK